MGYGLELMRLPDKMLQNQAGIALLKLQLKTQRGFRSCTD